SHLGTGLDWGFMTEALGRLHPLRLTAAAVLPRPRTAIGKVASLEAGLYLRNQLLRDTDWASMAHSLEVRVPLVDVHLLKAIAPVLVSLPAGAGKRLLAASPSTPLPRDTVDRAKTGFETPIRDWLQRDERLQGWRQVPELTGHNCPWARR